MRVSAAASGFWAHHRKGRKRPQNAARLGPVHHRLAAHARGGEGGYPGYGVGLGGRMTWPLSRPLVRSAIVPANCRSVCILQGHDSKKDFAAAPGASGPVPGRGAGRPPPVGQDHARPVPRRYLFRLPASLRPYRLDGLAQLVTAWQYLPSLRVGRRRRVTIALTKTYAQMPPAFLRRLRRARQGARCCRRKGRWTLILPASSRPGRVFPSTSRPPSWPWS